MRTLDPAASGTQAISRAAALLRALARYGREGARLLDLCRSTGLARPTVHRILQGLIEEQLVAQDRVTRLYRLGALVFELGLTTHQSATLIETCRPFLRRLADASEDTIYLVRRSGSDAACLDRVEGNFPIRTLTLEIGGRRPMGIGAGGLALLASLDDGEVAHVLQQNALNMPGFDLAAVEAAVARTREMGYSRTQGAITEGVDGIGMVVPTQEGLPWLAVSIASISYRMQPLRLLTLADLLRAELGKLSEFLARR